MKDFFSLEKEFESLEGFMIVRHPFVRLVSAYEVIYRGFYEKGSLRYLCARGIGRLNKCTLQEPFI